MKKYINKLFEWLGYVPKDIENRYKKLSWQIDTHAQETSHTQTLANHQYKYK